MARSLFHRSLVTAGSAAALGVFLTIAPALSAASDTVIDGPVNLGSAAPFGVLGGVSVTNTGPSIVNGDVGISPGTSVTGFDGAPDGVINGTLHQTDVVAASAQSDLTTAYNVAASLTPQQSGLTELAGLSLSPGVYSGGALILSDNGSLTLDGDAESVWVFQAASTLTIGAATRIIITGSASACNVFWQVGDSASLGSAAEFQGTVMANQSVTATAGATVVGRLLARNAAVTLDSDTITVPTACPTVGAPSVTTSPTITSGVPTGATVGTPYSFQVTAEGSPAPVFSITSGSLPGGLNLDSASGSISGTPTTPGTFVVTINASNGDTPDSEATFSLLVVSPAGPELANTGSLVAEMVAVAVIAVMLGISLALVTSRKRAARHLST